MASIIRETCFDDNGKPIPAVYNRIQQAIDDAGIRCTAKWKSGKNKGEVCGKRMRFIPTCFSVRCESSRHGAHYAYDEPFSKIVFRVINEIEQEQFEEEDKKRKDAFIRQRSLQEAKLLDITIPDDFCGIPRPDGRAPDGQTWSFLKGEWINTHPKKKHVRVQ